MYVQWKIDKKALCARDMCTCVEHWSLLTDVTVYSHSLIRRLGHRH